MKKNPDKTKVRLGYLNSRIVFSFKSGELHGSDNKKDVMKELKKQGVLEIEVSDFKGTASKKTYNIKDFPQKELEQFEQDYNTYIKQDFIDYSLDF